LSYTEYKDDDEFDMSMSLLYDDSSLGNVGLLQSCCRHITLVTSRYSSVYAA